MVSRNSKLKNRKQERQQQMQDQHDQQRRANIDAFLINSTSNIYSGLVAKEWDGGEPVVPREVLLKLAGLAKDAANALGEAMGFLNPPQSIQIFETPKPADDAVIEIPETPVATETPTIVLEPQAAESTLDSHVASETPTIVLESPASEELPTATLDSHVASETPTIVLESTPD